MKSQFPYKMHCSGNNYR